MLNLLQSTMFQCLIVWRLWIVNTRNSKEIFPWCFLRLLVCEHGNTLAKPMRWAPWVSIYAMYFSKSRNSSMVGLKVIILYAEFAPGGGPGVGSRSSNSCTLGSKDSECRLKAGSESEPGGGTAEFSRVGAGVEFMASSGVASTDMFAGKLKLDTQTDRYRTIKQSPKKNIFIWS